MIDVARKMIQGARDHVLQPATIKSAVRKKLPAHELLQRLRAQLAKGGMSKVQIERRIAAVGTKKILAMWEEHMDDHIQEMIPAVDQVISEHTSALPASMRQHFIDALSDGLDDNPRAQSYRRLNWFVLPTSEKLILGDCACFFETGGARNFRPWDDESSPGIRAFLPIAPNHLLIGTHESKTPDVDVVAVNQASARCSLEFFVSAQRLNESEAQLHGSIGVWSGIASDDEINEIWQQIKNDL